MMKLFTAPLVICVLLVGALGVVHGVYSDRWGPSGQLEQAVKGLDRVSTGFGDWAGENLPFEHSDMARAGIEGTVLRRYHNPRTRESVSLLVVCGRGGPICVHTPDICYADSGYTRTGDEKPASIDLGKDGTHSFRVIRFAKTDSVSPNHLEIYWSWSRDGRSWLAPDNPRLILARSPALYKIYVVREFIPGTRAESTEVCREFLNRALPEICRKLPSDADGL